MQKIGETKGTVTSEKFYDEDGDALVVRYSDDVEATLASNKAAQAAFTGFDRREVFHKVAEIPAIMIVKWLTEEGLNFYKKEDFDLIIKRKLNNPDYQFLKTIPGRI